MNNAAVGFHLIQKNTDGSGCLFLLLEGKEHEKIFYNADLLH